MLNCQSQNFLNLNCPKVTFIFFWFVNYNYFQFRLKYDFNISFWEIHPFRFKVSIESIILYTYDTFLGHFVKYMLKPPISKQMCYFIFLDVSAKQTHNVNKNKIDKISCP